jgi:hypothetical protein
MALERLRWGGPAFCAQRRKIDPNEIKRLYAPPEILRFGDRKGEAVISIAPDQEQSVILHNAFNNVNTVSRNAPAKIEGAKLVCRQGQMTKNSFQYPDNFTC